MVFVLVTPVLTVRTVSATGSGPVPVGVFCLTNDPLTVPVSEIVLSTLPPPFKTDGINVDNVTPPEGIPATFAAPLFADSGAERE